MAWTMTPSKTPSTIGIEDPVDRKGERQLGNRVADEAIRRKPYSIGAGSFKETIGNGLMTTTPLPGRP
jgi:hypothetical protein